MQLHGVDLKGGMEILMGADLFTTRATDAGEAVALLERPGRPDAGAHAAATPAGSGPTSPTVDEPLHVVMIDELAALTAYCPERDLQRRAEMAINLLCSQGRAPGFVVFACLQDPRKEVIPSRGLFTQMVGLRLKDASETSMVLGEAAVASGRAVPPDHPRDAGHRVRRAGGRWVPDPGPRRASSPTHEIRSVATEFATPIAPGCAPARRPRARLDRRRPPPAARIGGGLMPTAEPGWSTRAAGAVPDLPWICDREQVTLGDEAGMACGLPLVPRVRAECADFVAARGRSCSGFWAGDVPRPAADADRRCRMSARARGCRPRPCATWRSTRACASVR